MFLFVCLLVFVGGSSAIISPPNKELEAAAAMFNQWRATRNEFIDSMNHPMGLPHFNCSRSSFEAPTSIHQLHPSQIDVVAALGDSVSVAQAAQSASVFDLLEKYPGIGFVTGDDVAMKEQATLFNMFRQFSPRIKGGSSDRIRRFYDFNFAVPGSFSYNLVDQAKNLSRTLQRRLKDDNENTWKFVNLFIGHNDLCQYCTNKTLYGPETFGRSIRSALSIIQSRIPKVFVNIMPPINVHIHSQAHNVSQFCEVSHRKLCPCIFEMSEEQYQEVKKAFDDELEKIANEFATGSADFAVVIATAMDLESIPLLGNTTNVALLALDCFHLSPIAHDIAAKQIWKGLFEKVGNKSVTSELSTGLDRFVCPPRECPYLRTNENSKSCEPPKELRVLQIPVAGMTGSNLPVMMLFGFFVFGSALVMLFVRASFRRPMSSFSDERRHLLLPMRADLNDNIF